MKLKMLTLAAGGPAASLVLSACSTNSPQMQRAGLTLVSNGQTVQANGQNTQTNA